MKAGAIDPAVVSICDSKGRQLGSGFLVSEGTVLTAAHVVGGSQRRGDSRFTVRLLAPSGNRDSASAKLSHVNMDTDIAVLVCELVEVQTALVAEPAVGDEFVISGVAELYDPGRSTQYLSAVGVIVGPAKRDGVPLIMGQSAGVLPGMSGGAIRRIADGAILGILSGRYNSADGWARDTVWIAPLEGVLGATADTAIVAGGPGGSSHVALPAPTPPADFVGRSKELSALQAASSSQPSGGLLYLEGPAGAGKTSLALKWLASYRPRANVARVYLDLRGFAPTDRPLRSEEALEELLLRLGVEPSEIPGPHSARVATLGRVGASGVTLLVLDNVRTSDQIAEIVRSLPSALICIASRNFLPDFIASGDDRIVHVGGLDRRDAKQLVVNRLGARMHQDDWVVSLLEACELMPLALRVACERLLGTPIAAIPSVVDELVNESTRLSSLVPPGGGASVAVGSVVAWSLRALDDEDRFAAAVLATFPGDDLIAESVAARLSVPVHIARSRLLNLQAANLIRLPAPDGDYQMYDLVRLTAQTLEEVCPKRQVEEIDRRTAHWYALSCVNADRLVAAYRAPIRLTNAERLNPLLDFGSQRTALLWYERERSNILKVVRRALELNEYEAVYQIATAAWGFYERRRYLSDWIESHEFALEASTQLGNVDYRCRVLDNLGIAYVEAGRFDDGQRCLETAIDAWRTIGDIHGESASTDSLGLLQARRGEIEEALELFDKAIALCITCGDHWGRGRAQLHAATALASRSRFADAKARARASIQIYEQVEDALAVARSAAVVVLCDIMMGEESDAREALSTPIRVHEDADDKIGSALCLLVLSLGIVRSDSAISPALSQLANAHAILSELGDRRATSVRRVSQMVSSGLTGDATQSILAVALDMVR